ncbi:MAG TPA: DoxX family membrane protein [candidate division Zixibacteria bacterium]|nr:DoxX family membrane protein [candidate division Zixibacteria bacterium]
MAALRRYVTWIAVVAAVILVWLQLPEDWPISRPEGTLNTALTVVFWVLSVVVVLVLFTDRHAPAASVVEVDGPAFARYLFSNTRAGLFWLPIRLFLGFSWLTSGLGKLTGEGWLDGGSALAAYWERAVAIPEPPARPAITYDWYREFLQFLLNGNHETWFSWLIVFGEIAVGLGLLVGALTGIAAFFGALMNMSFLLAGSASTNPVLFTAAIGLILAWRVAGYYGLDRYLLPALGTPWRAPVREASATGGT